MVHEMTGDLLSCDADYICHQTNFYGVMGAGVAASIHSKLLSPAAYSVYQRLCRKMGRDNGFHAIPYSWCHAIMRGGYGVFGSKR